MRGALTLRRHRYTYWAASMTKACLDTSGSREHGSRIFLITVFATVENGAQTMV